MHSSTLALGVLIEVHGAERGNLAESPTPMRDVFLTFLRLGSTSFGGPIAHLGYFRREFVDRRSWVDADRFAQIVAFCSILPGPTSSQVGMIVGLLRAGYGGAVCAWLGFTLPSALALTIVAALLTTVEGSSAAASPVWLDGLLAGLSAAATAIVATAVLAMAKSQCPDRPTKTIAAAAGVLALAAARVPTAQWLPIAAGALGGAIFLNRQNLETAGAEPAAPALALPPWVSRTAAIMFVVLATVAALGSGTSTVGTFVATIVRAGSLVFGGGHVVLPLLASLVTSGIIPARDFYAGYGAAQAVPGPLFTFAAFLGSANHSALHGPIGAAAAIVLIFLPSFLLIFAALPALNALLANRAAGGALRGANAGVVGLLAALLYSPLLLALATSIGRTAIAIAAFTLVTAWRVAPWVAVLLAALAGAIASSAGFSLG